MRKQITSTIKGTVTAVPFSISPPPPSPSPLLRHCHFTWHLLSRPKIPSLFLRPFSLCVCFFCTFWTVHHFIFRHFTLVSRFFFSFFSNLLLFPCVRICVYVSIYYSHIHSLLIYFNFLSLFYSSLLSYSIIHLQVFPYSLYSCLFHFLGFSFHIAPQLFKFSSLCVFSSSLTLLLILLFFSLSFIIFLFLFLLPLVNLLVYSFLPRNCFLLFFIQSFLIFDLVSFLTVSFHSSTSFLSSFYFFSHFLRIPPNFHYRFPFSSISSLSSVIPSPFFL